METLARFHIVDGFIIDYEDCVPVKPVLTLGDFKFHPGLVLTMRGYERVFVLVQHLNENNKHALVWFRQSAPKTWYTTAYTQKLMERIIPELREDFRECVNSLYKHVVKNLFGFRNKLKNNLTAIEYDGNTYIIDTASMRKFNGSMTFIAGKLPERPKPVKIEPIRMLWDCILDFDTEEGKAVLEAAVA